MLVSLFDVPTQSSIVILINIKKDEKYDKYNGNLNDINEKILDNEFL